MERLYVIENGNYSQYHNDIMFKMLEKYRGITILDNSSVYVNGTQTRVCQIECDSDSAMFIHQMSVCDLLFVTPDLPNWITGGATIMYVILPMTPMANDMYNYLSNNQDGICVTSQCVGRDIGLGAGFENNTVLRLEVYNESSVNLINGYLADGSLMDASPYGGKVQYFIDRQRKEANSLPGGVIQ